MTPYFQTELGSLYCGDCYTILPQLEVSPTILLTDPMWGIGANTQGKSTRRGERLLKGIFVQAQDWAIMPDDTPFDPAPWLSFPQIILWGGNTYADKLPASKKWLIWDKRGKNGNQDDNADCEIAWTNLPGVSRIYRQLWKGICRAGEENIARQGAKLHPFQKPVGLMTWCLQQCKIDKNTVVLDPFAGSCSTAVACERLRVRWVAIELLDHFCEIGAKRLEQPQSLELFAAREEKAVQ